QDLANRLRLGSFAEDGLSYKEKFMVRTYEVGINAVATIESMANYLQDATCNCFQSIDEPTGGSYSSLMKELHLTLVTTRMHIEIYRYPSWSNVVQIETWFQLQGKVRAQQHYIITDHATGEVIGRAVSDWVAMNTNTRQLQKIPDEIHHRLYTKNLSSSSRSAFPEGNNSGLRKIDKLEDPARFCKTGITPRHSDIDPNLHVNNVTYIGWILESLPLDIFQTQELEAITLQFRHECRLHDVVDSLASPEPVFEDDKNKRNGGYDQFIHLLRFSNQGYELNRARTLWRRK
ncbi:oleoyl-acyl carrier protein thioesterase, partial [Genlisea aurea]